MTQTASIECAGRGVLYKIDVRCPVRHDIDAKGSGGLKVDDGYHRRNIFETRVYKLNQLGKTPCPPTLKQQVNEAAVTENEQMLYGNEKRDINWHIARKRDKLKAIPGDRRLGHRLRKLASRQGHYPFQWRASLRHRDEPVPPPEGALQGFSQEHGRSAYPVRPGQSRDPQTKPCSHLRAKLRPAQDEKPGTGQRRPENRAAFGAYEKGSSERQKQPAATRWLVRRRAIDHRFLRKKRE